MRKYLVIFILFSFLVPTKTSAYCVLANTLTGTCEANSLVTCSDTVFCCSNMAQECPCDLMGLPTPPGGFGVGGVPPTPGPTGPILPPGSTQYNQCIKCYQAAPVGTRVWTAIGCVNAGFPGGGPGLAGPNLGLGGGVGGIEGTFIGQILGWATILGAGIAFLMAVFGGFQITTAAGDPKRVKAAQEMITAAIMGLLLIVFSIFLLNLIGFNVLSFKTLMPTLIPSI